MTKAQERIAKLVELSEVGRKKPVVDNQEPPVLTKTHEILPTLKEDVTFVFVERANGPESLVCEAEVHFHSGVMEGMKLVGFSLWRSPDGEVYVTFPSRAFGLGGERRFFDYLRSIEGAAADAKRVKTAILDAFKARR